jgi:mannose-1-phosphate guanylyltransferase/mannose-6-phosphate isomerase
MAHIQPVILCGGSGTRLWPLSRSGFPKQFLCLTGDDSLFQQAAKRLSVLGEQGDEMSEPIIVCHEDHRFLAQEQLREAGIVLGAALLEPVGRNTAPALTLAALHAIEKGHNPILVVTPADQSVKNLDSFTLAMRQAIENAESGGIVILGIQPDRPETGYGYIKIIASEIQGSVAQVDKFVEKPNSETVQRYLAEGGYFWNAGMFILKASVWLKALKEFRPNIANTTQAAWHNKTIDAKFVRPGKVEFAVVPSESVDYAVMEHCPGSQFGINMVALDAGWSDLGAWDAVWDVMPKDEQGNAHVGDVLLTYSHNSLVQATSRLVTLVGVRDLVVIETPDAVLVADKTRSQEVKHIVAALQKSGRGEHTLHRKVHRPWGWYDSIVEAEGFKVKRIMVKPGASLSLQKHHNRAEHWIVVKGTAEITNGDKVFLLTENQSTYIPLGEVHRLANPGNSPLEIIEVQSGSYLGEDDIVRFEDSYGRSNNK